MLRPFLVALCVSAITATVTAGQQPPGDAALPDGFVLWSSDHVHEVADRLEKTIGDRSMVFETIRNDEGHSVYFVLRGATARAEFHETESDLYVVHRGRATLVIGGELIDAEGLPRKQQRGSGIRGGSRRELTPGDIVHIPVAVPHQLVIAPGEQFLYELVKFDEEPLPVGPHRGRARLRSGASCAGSSAILPGKKMPATSGSRMHGSEGGARSSELGVPEFPLPRPLIPDPQFPFPR